MGYEEMAHPGTTRAASVLRLNKEFKSPELSSGQDSVQEAINSHEKCNGK